MLKHLLRKIWKRTFAGDATTIQRRRGSHQRPQAIVTYEWPHHSYIIAYFWLSDHIGHTLVTRQSDFWLSDHGDHTIVTRQSDFWLSDHIGHTLVTWQSDFWLSDHRDQTVVTWQSDFWLSDHRDQTVHVVTLQLISGYLITETKP